MSAPAASGVVSDAVAAALVERGNGFPGVGDYVAGDDGEVYVVVSLGTVIHTGQPGSSAWIDGTVRLGDWGDVTEETEPTCVAFVGDEAAAQEVAS